MQGSPAAAQPTDANSNSAQHAKSIGIGFQRHLCSICRSVLCSKVQDSIKRSNSFDASTQTFEAFKNAVEDHCIICSVVWSLSLSYRHIWSDLPQLWKPMRFLASKIGDRGISCVQIIREHPTMGFIDFIDFYLIPTDDKFYKELLSFPTLAAKVTREDTLTKGKTWLAHCRSFHPECYPLHSSTSKWHPSRLLDVGLEDRATWKLCVVSEDGISSPSAEYLTLSYRWGQDSKLVLLSSNIASLRLGSPICDLPILFQDFIAIARNFSIRYVWIDALCIIQDSNEDWEVEAPTMQEVYSNSACTIAASSSQSPEDGLFHDRDSNKIQIGLADTWLYSAKPAPHFIIDRSYWDRQMRDGPLHSRAWFFQERLLSPRVLYFAKHQLFWDCHTEHKCEALPCGTLAGYYNRTNSRLLRGKFPNVNAKLPREMSNSTLNLWIELVREYSECNLSNISDKLPAIAGIAKFFQQMTGDQYLAGLWKSRFQDMMDWTVFEPETCQSKVYRAPSWSWASVQGSVSQMMIYPDQEPLVELVDIRVETRTQDEMSTVIYGHVTLRGRLVRTVCQRIEKKMVTFKNTTSPADPEFSVQYYPDALDLGPKEGSIVSYMPLRMNYRYYRDQNGKTEPFISCLVLKQLSQACSSQNQFCRIGHFELVGRDKNDPLVSGPQSIFCIV